MNKVYINILSKKGNDGGSKARSDINRVLRDRGYTELAIPFLNNCSSILKAIKKLILNIDSNSTVVMQVPMGRKLSLFLLIIHKLIRFKLIIIIHDIEELRKIYIKRKYQITVERKFYQNCDVLICHNNNMKNHLIGRNISANKIIPIEIFDYILDSNEQINCNINKNILIIAGNLTHERCPYVYLLKQLCLKNTQIVLYGFGYGSEDEKNEKISYQGCFSPEEMPNILETGWGLAWDGESLDSCTGDTGEYLVYINQHKISLYLSAGLPVILWEKSGLAPFIKENKAGIAISSLRNIENILKQITDEQYKEMQNNARSLAQKLRKGYFAHTAIEKAETILNI